MVRLRSGNCHAKFETKILVTKFKKNFRRGYYSGKLWKSCKKIGTSDIFKYGFKEFMTIIKNLLAKTKNKDHVSCFQLAPATCV